MDVAVVSEQGDAAERDCECTERRHRHRAHQGAEPLRLRLRLGSHPLRGDRRQSEIGQETEDADVRERGRPDPEPIGAERAREQREPRDPKRQVARPSEQLDHRSPGNLAPRGAGGLARLASPCMA